MQNWERLNKAEIEALAFALAPKNKSAVIKKNADEAAQNRRGRRQNSVVRILVSLHETHYFKLSS